MVVKAEIKINYNVDSQKWEGDIYIYLPAKDGFLVPELRSPSTEVFGYSLHKERGSLVGDFRRIWKAFKFSNEEAPEEIMEKLEEKLKTEVKKIKNVYKENLERMRASVHKEYEFYF